MYFFIDQKCYSLISQIGTAQKGHLLYTILTLTLYHFDTYSIPLYHFDTYSIPFLTLPKDFSHKLKLKKKLDYPW